jgi:hypothetical protein
MRWGLDLDDEPDAGNSPEVFLRGGGRSRQWAAARLVPRTLVMTVRGYKVQPTL